MHKANMANRKQIERCSVCGYAETNAMTLPRAVLRSSIHSKGRRNNHSISHIKIEIH